MRLNPFIISVIYPALLLSSAARAQEEETSSDPGETSIVLEELDRKATELVENLASRERKVDPFGLSMNPETGSTLELAVPDDAEEDERVNTSLGEALQKLHITGVAPQRGSVIISARPLRRGDQFIIENEGVMFRLQLVEVTLQAIRIQDLDTAEVVTHELGILPSLQSQTPQTEGEVFQSMSSIMTIK